MSYYDYYLSAETEDAMNAALVEAGVARLDDETGELAATEGNALSVIGYWMEPSVEGSDEEPVMVEVPGWHVNLRAVEPVELPKEITISTPNTPWRVWA